MALGVIISLVDNEVLSSWDAVMVPKLDKDGKETGEFVDGIEKGLLEVNGIVPPQQRLLLQEEDFESFCHKVTNASAASQEVETATLTVDKEDKITPTRVKINGRVYLDKGKKNFSVGPPRPVPARGLDGLKVALTQDASIASGSNQLTASKLLKLMDKVEKGEVYYE